MNGQARICVGVFCACKARSANGTTPSSKETLTMKELLDQPAQTKDSSIPPSAEPGKPDAAKETPIFGYPGLISLARMIDEEADRAKENAARAKASPPAEQAGQAPSAEPSSPQGKATTTPPPNAAKKKSTAYEHPLITAAREGRLQDVIIQLGECPGRVSEPWQHFRTCVQNVLKRSPAELAEAIIGELVSFQFEIYTRCRIYVAHELKLADRRDSFHPVIQITPIMQEWGPRLSRIQQELKDILKLQSQLRHVHGIADREAVRRKVVESQLGYPDTTGHMGDGAEDPDGITGGRQKTSDGKR